MQDQFDFENNIEQSDAFKKEELKKKLRVSSNRIGWATVVLVSVWMAIIYGFYGLVYLICSTTRTTELAEFYNSYYIILNEVALAIALAVALLVLPPVTKSEMEYENFSASKFVKILFMCFGAGYIGNQIGTVMLSFWNGFTGNSVGDELTAVLSQTNPLFMLISVGILAPILEELFFRKLLTDRLRAFGESTAIIVPAFLFAMFHQSASQLIYAFTVGIFLGYFYCRTGKYWLTVLIHAVFNTISGVIPVLYLPKVTTFLNETQAIIENNADLDSTVMTEQLMPLVEQYGLIVLLFLLHTLIVFAINIIGVIFIVFSFKKYQEKKTPSSLSFGESFNIIFRTPGIFACTIVLSIMTIISLFI